MTGNNIVRQPLDLSTDSLYKTLFTGYFTKKQVTILWEKDSQILPDELKNKMNSFWQREIKETGKTTYLFNGNLCRLNNWHIENAALTFDLGNTTYKELLYSNKYHRDLVKQFGEACLSKALGISLILTTNDNRLILIKRSENVGESPGKFDVIGGHVTPDEHLVNDIPDLFLAMADELKEEVNLSIKQEQMAIIGLLETRFNQKPELIFAYQSVLSAGEIIQTGTRQSSTEIADFLHIENDKHRLTDFLDRNHKLISPSAFGALRLYIQNQFN